MKNSKDYSKTKKKKEYLKGQTLEVLRKEAHHLIHLEPSLSSQKRREPLGSDRVSLIIKSETAFGILFVCLDCLHYSG